MEYGAKFLGKTTVLAKILQRSLQTELSFSMMNLLHNVKSIGLNVTEVDKLTGPVIGTS